MIQGLQGEDLPRLGLALPVRLQQPRPKTGADFAEFGEALTQLFVLLATIVRRAMFGRHLTFPRHAAGQQAMTGEFFQVQPVDDQFVLGHP